MEIQIGDQFTKQLSGGKSCECTIVDIVNRISTATGERIGIEYWAKCTSGNYATGQTFEVAKNTILRSRLTKVQTEGFSPNKTEN